MSHSLGSLRLERITLTSILLVFAYVLVFFILSRFGLVHGRYLLALAGAGATAWGFHCWFLPPQISPPKSDNQSILACLLVIGIAGAVLFVVTQPGYVLAGHDPLIVPSLAEALLSHATTMDVYQPGDQGFTYPPGYPILFSNIRLLLTPLQALIAFKAWTIILTVLLPIGWAWMARRIFLVPLPFWLILLLSYVAVFGLERTVTLSLEHGKNTQMLAGAVFPFLIGLLLITTCSSIGLPFAVTALAGAILVHYSIFYMVVTFFTAYVLIFFPRKREEWVAVIRLGMVGILSLSLFVLLLRPAFSDPGAGSFGLPQPIEGMRRAAGVLLRKLDELLFIFNGPRFGVYHSPYRGLFLIGCLLVSLATLYFPRKVDARLSAVARMAGVFGIMVLIGIAFGTGTLQLGITPDYTRWYLIFPQAALIIAALCSVVLFARGEGRGARAASLALVGAAVLATVLVMSDLLRIAEVFRTQRVSQRELINVRDVLADATPCFLITQSTTTDGGLRYMQAYKPLEYAEDLTGCRILNGSFLQRGTPEGRVMDGLPSAAVLAALPASAAIFLIVPEPIEVLYHAALPNVQFVRQEAQIGPLPVSRIRLGSSPQ
jgi:hypothetical protein